MINTLVINTLVLVLSYAYVILCLFILCKLPSMFLEGIKKYCLSLLNESDEKLEGKEKFDKEFKKRLFK